MWYVGYKSCDNLNEYIRTDKGCTAPLFVKLGSGWNYVCVGVYALVWIGNMVARRP